jgi:hypothetical protein
MTWAQWIGLGLLAVPAELFVFVFFACDQGAKVRLEKNKDPFGGLPSDFPWS